MQFTVPPPGSFTPATSACSCTLAQVTITSCTVSGNTVTMAFTISIGTSGSLTFKVTNFNNPPSTTAITGIIGTYSDTISVPIQTYTTAQLSGLQPNIMSSSPLYTSDNPTIGATGATLTVKFTPDYSIPSNGQISLTFPTWSSSQQMIQTNSPTCMGTSPMNAGLICSFNTISLTLTITNIASSALSASTQYTFTVNNLRNPYSGAPKSGFILQTLDNVGGQMQSTTLGSLQVTAFASFASASIDLRGDSMTTVSELSILQPSFELDLPLDPFCRLRITFPLDMPLTTDLIQVTGTSPFIFTSTNSFYSNTAGNQYVEINGCQTSFSTSTNYGFLILTSLKNKAYVQSTSSFTFTLYAYNGATVYNIAEQTTGITINDFTPGIITGFTVTSATANYNVQETTTFLCTITPAHDIPSSSQIKIQFPAAIVLNSGACTIGSTTGVMSTSPSSCNIALNTITIVNPFGGSSYSATNGAFQFTFQTALGSSGTNPISATATTGAFIVNTYAINTGTYQIDSSTFSNIYVGVATVLGAVSVTATPNTACTSPASYTFSITPNKQIPSSGKIKIIFPIEVTLPSGTLSSCQTVISGSTNNSPTCTVSSTSPVTVTISGSAVFSVLYTATGTPFTVTLNGLTNPTSTTASSTFQVFTMDSSSNQIEYATSGILVTMGSMSSINSVTSSLSSSTNGATGNILMTVINSCPLATNSVFYFTIPSEVTVPTGVACSVTSGLSSITCSNTGNAITATLSVASTLAVGSTFKFTINSITNPSSTCVTSAFSAISLAPPASSANAYTGTNPTLQTSVVPTATGSLQQANYAFSTQNDYTIVYTNNIQISSGSTFKIGYPSGITVNTLTSCYLTVSTFTYVMSCTYTSTAPRYIYMTSTGLSVNVPAPGSIMITFGPITNPSTSTTLPTLTLVSYTDQAQSCAVEQVTSNMLVGFPCTYPCYTCQPATKTYCLSCDQTDANGYIYLCNNQCLQLASVQTTLFYTDTNHICQACQTQCLACTSAVGCTSCNTAGVYPIFYLNDCIVSCPTGFYSTTIAGILTCAACDSTCKTCNGGTSSNCVTCDTTVTSVYPYFYSNQCLTTCPSNTILIGTTCIACTSNCATCLGSVSTCLTCVGGYFLYGTTCVNSCPTTTVGVTTVTPNACQSCGSGCASCLSTSTTTCLSCIATYVLSSSACYASCPAATYLSAANVCSPCSSPCVNCFSASTQCTSCDPASSYPILSASKCLAGCPTNTIYNGVACVPCASPCSTCSTSTTRCTSCIGGYFLYQNTCITPCPSTTVAVSTVTPAICSTCGSYCATCNSASPSTCITCITGYYFYAGQCLAQCPQSTYLIIVTNTCSACSSPCLDCAGSPTNCVSCNTQSALPILYSGTCIATCPAGYVLSLGTCIPCTSPCATCSPTAAKCLTCITNYYLLVSQSTCVNKCPSGTVLVGNQCQGCTTNCQVCSTSTSVCTQCVAGYYLYQNQCYKVCPNNLVIDTTGTLCVSAPASSSSTPTPSSSSSQTSSSQPPTSSSSSQTANITTIPANSTDQLVYFPVTTSQTILGGIALGSFFKDPASLIFSNTLALWAPLEFVAYGGQAYLAYVQETKDQSQYDFVHGTGSTYKPTSLSSSSSNSSNITNSSRRQRLLQVQAVSNLENKNSWPLVLYGTVAALVIMIVSNTIWAVVHCVLVNKDNQFKDHKARNRCSTNIIHCCSSILSFKIARFHHSRFYGLSKFSAQYEQETRVQNILNTLTIVNMLFTLLPIIFVDIYGIVMHKWGNQYYMVLIETLLLSLCVIVISIFEFRHSKIKKNSDYVPVKEPTALDEEALMRKIDEQIRNTMGGGLNEFIERLKKEKGITADGELKGRGRSQSMTDLNRDLEYDDRRVHTDPLDEETKQDYLNRPNPFLRDNDKDHFNNCYAEPGKGPKNFVDESNRRIKIIQTGERATDGERLYENQHEGDTDDGKRKKYNKNKMRGRKDKYYEQVDHEDMSFADDGGTGRVMDDEDEDDDEIDQTKQVRDDASLGQIEEESHQEDDEELMQQKLAQEQLAQKQKLEQEILLKEQQRQKDIENQKNLELQKQQEEKDKQKKLLEEQKQKEEQIKKKKEEEQKAKETEDKLKKQQLEEQKRQQEQLEKERLKQLEDAQKAKEDQILKEQELLKNQQEPDQNVFEEQLIQEDMVASQGLPIQNANPKQKQLEDEENILKDQQQIQQTPQKSSSRTDKSSSKKSEDERGEPDSDDDNENRIRNMTNPNLRKFNVNDILGEFDRDDKGNLVMLQNQKGNLIDKQGNKVNEKGYLIDEKTGDVVEREGKNKVFDKKDLDDRGELPPPFNIERFNFNAHDVRGHFDRDPQTGQEIVGNKRNQFGQIVDKLGRVVNEHGYLVDKQGNIVDKRGRIRLHHKQLDKVDGNMPLLFNYKGKKFDIRDIIGDFEKDRGGNIIIRRDKLNQMVDKKGRKVNNKGYLIDDTGNVINQEGKMMFEHFALSKDNEVPKFFPFLKFNVDDIKGEYEMDPLGNPMLQKNRSGELIDNKGRKVNEKGYLIDDTGNIKNKRGYKVFGKVLMEDDGEIPKVFRTGIFRKDTIDSFNQLMNEIEDLEKMHEINANKASNLGNQLDNSKSPLNYDEENDRIARRIEQIVEEDNDDDDQIFKEIEDMGQGGESEGGNTSVDGRMEDTPSNYNLENQRFEEQKQMRDRVKQQIKNNNNLNDQSQLQNSSFPHLVDEQDDEESGGEYNLPGKKIKRRKKKHLKKKKKKEPKEPEIDIRDLKMAQAYGGLSQAEVDRLIIEKKRKAMALANQLHHNNSRPPINKNASNSRLGSMQSKRAFKGVTPIENTDGENWDGNMNLVEGNIDQNMGNRFGGPAMSTTNRNAVQVHGKSQAKRTGGGYLMGDGVRTNNLMNSTHNSFRQGDNQSQTNIQNRQPQVQGNIPDRRLSNIANSVSGFYREQTLSEQSKMRSTHESNIAANMPGGLNIRRIQNDDMTGGEEENKQYPQYNQSQLTHPVRFGGMEGGAETFDPEIERLYGAAKGFGDLSMLSDWEKESALSGQSGFTNVGQGGPGNNKKIRGLESIYLQRLEPATKGKGGKRKQQRQQQPEEKGKFRAMHNQFHDGAEWHVDDQQRDELDSVLSDNYKQMERKFKEEHFKGSGEGSKSKSKQGFYGEESNKPNIFHGNLYQYKLKQEQKRQQSMLNFDKPI